MREGQKRGLEIAEADEKSEILLTCGGFTSLTAVNEKPLLNQKKKTNRKQYQDLPDSASSCSSSRPKTAVDADANAQSQENPREQTANQGTVLEAHDHHSRSIRGQGCPV